MSIKSCNECFEKQRKIDQLKVENERLKAKPHRYEKKAKNGYFGSSTPSSKKPFKENAIAEAQNKNGGAKPGHVGVGRKAHDLDNVDHVRQVSLSGRCPKCGGELKNKGVVTRSIIDLKPPKTEKIIIECEKGYCPHCKASIQAMYGPARECKEKVFSFWQSEMKDAAMHTACLWRALFSWP